MKDWKKCIIGGSLALSSLIVLQGVQASAQSTNNSVTGNNIQLTTNSTSSEKEKALAAGYSEEQYNQIMKIPDFASDKILSPEANNLTSNQLKVINEAQKYLGVPYVWGGTTPSGFDCSGLVQWVYSHAVGINLPRVTWDQEKVGTDVSLNALQAGDLLYWGDRGNSYHVAIYIGNNQYIHAPEPGQNVKVGNMVWFAPSFAKRVLPTNSKDDDHGKMPSNDGQKQNEQYIHRMYNSNAGSHHYTASLDEAKNLYNLGWNDEGIGWIAPTTGTPVYRLYNPNNGRHLYTLSAGERDSLVNVGWSSEGTAWHSGGSTPVYRLYNSHAADTEDSHHYTTNSNERDNLVKLGWSYEGVSWYALGNK